MQRKTSDFKKYIWEKCDQNSHKPFLEQYAEPENLTYAQFKEAIISHPIESLGLTPNQTVLLGIENDIQSVILLFALLSRGIRFVIAKKTITEYESLRICSLLNIQHKISYDEELIVQKIETEDNKKQETSFPAHIAYFIFTSGSSGNPKGIQITYDNIIEETQSLVRTYQFDGEDTHLCLLPIYHVASLYRNVMVPFDQGAKSIMLRNFKHAELWSILNEKSVTFTQITPTIIRNLINNGVKTFQKPNRLKFIGSASAPHPEELVKQFETMFNIPIIISYGMTEVNGGVTVNSDVPRKNYSVGKAIDIANIKIVDESGNELEPNENGEVVISGKNVMAGYINPDNQDHVKYEEGNLYGGDLGYLDEEGYLYITGRKNDIVKRAGLRINLLEIENAFYNLDYIKDVAIIDVPHDVIGTDIVAFSVLDNKNPIKSRKILSHLRKFLDQTKLPSEVLIVDEIPKLETQKVDKRQLKKSYQSILQGRKKEIAAR